MRAVAWEGALLCVVAGCSGQPSAAGRDAGNGLADGWDESEIGFGGLSVTPTSLVFGLVDIGSTSSPRRVTITNQGPATVVAPTVTGTSFLLSGDACQDILATGRSCELSVRFAPVAAGTVDDVLTIAPGVTVSLLGSGSPCEGARLVTDRVDLGTLPLNTTAQVLVQLSGPSCARVWVTCLPAGRDLTSDAANTTCPTVGPTTFPCSFAFIFRAATPGTKVETIVCSGGGTTATTTVTAEVIGAQPDIDGGVDYDTGAID
jgi:hypothetical protein